MDKVVPGLLGGYTGGSIVAPALDREKMPLLEFDLTFDLLPNITASLGEVLYITGNLCAVVAAVIAIYGLYREIKRAKQRKRRVED